MTMKQDAGDPGAERLDALMEMEPSAVMAAFRAGRINRRDVFKLLGALGLTAAGASLLRADALAADDLKLIIWEGYADDKYRKPFESSNKVTVAPTNASTGDEMFGLMNDSGGKNFDLVSASSDLPRRLYDKGLLAEIDTSKLTNYDKLFDQFKKPSYITFDGKLYGVNFAWGPTIMIYDTEAITTAPMSWTAMLDEKYKGKIATWNYPLQIAQFALMLTPAPADPFELNDEQLAQVKAMIKRQRPLIRKYWDYGQETWELFQNKEIVIADGWPYVTINALAKGAKVAEVSPVEGVTGWSDSWCISKHAANYDLALKWADWMIGEEAQIGVTEVMNYSITNKDAIAKLSAERKKALRMTDVPTDYAKIHMWRFIPASEDKWVPPWHAAPRG
ncbi:MAG: extracellular solute-binding protein [Thermomicrobiales bacterium]